MRGDHQKATPLFIKCEFLPVADNFVYEFFD